jgi:glycosyltransferase involved in cell wall biosynthesis
MSSAVLPSPAAEQTEPASLRRGDHAHIDLTYVAAVYFDQRDASTLIELLQTYAGYSRDVLDRTQFIIVDDGSPIEVKIPDDLDLNLLVLRITEDIPWNQPGARNLGMVYARSDKVLITDIDHEVPEATFRRVLGMRDPGRTMYKIHRRTHEGAPERAHPNTFVLSRARFLRLYGYDEELCGHWGSDDPMLCRWQRYHGTRFRYLPKSCYITRRKVDERRSYHSLDRDRTHNNIVSRRKIDQWKNHGPAAGHSRQFLCFHWQVALDRRRAEAPPPPKVNRIWARTWWWRWLVGGTR